MTTAQISDRTAAYVQALNTSAAAAGSARTYGTTTGRRYVKVCEMSRYTPGRPAAVHAFIDAATGAVLKPEGWAKPAKGVRFDLTDDDSYARLITAATDPLSFCGGYLYM